ncbi:MAG: hypothetical protein R3E97_21605 [Candidatus Eisenbacteria bacterium]
MKYDRSESIVKSPAKTAAKTSGPSADDTPNFPTAPRSCPDRFWKGGRNTTTASTNQTAVNVSGRYAWRWNPHVDGPGRKRPRNERATSARRTPTPIDGRS